MNIIKKIEPILDVVLPIKFRIFIFFWYKQGYMLNFCKPTKFSEKIQIRKLSLSQKDADLADKFKVREYVAKQIGKQYLIPLVGVFKQFTPEIFNSLPTNSVIKTTHGSGANHIHFLSPDSKSAEIVTQFNNALNEDYVGSFFGETHYDLIERNIIVESKLVYNGSSPPDYKFHVFKKNNEVNWFLQIDFDRFIDHKRNYYDSNLNLLNLEVIYPSGEFLLPPNEIIYKMSRLAIILNGNLNYSRIDLYLHNDKIYFGEITLTPGSGFEKFSNKKYELVFGKLWG